LTFQAALVPALCLILALSVSRAQTPTAQSAPTREYIRAGKLLDVRSGKVLTDQVIIIQGERIESIEPFKNASIPAGARAMDLSHRFVLPGLIDAHTHIFLTGEDNGRYDEQLLKESWQYRTIEAVVNARKDLEAGFTSMRDLETEGAMYSDVDVRNAINRGLVPGPRLQVATRALSVTGGYPLEDYSPEVSVPTGVQIVDGPEEARHAVREQIKYGADWILDQGLRHAPFSFHCGWRHVESADVHARGTRCYRGRSSSPGRESRLPRLRGRRIDELH
jgi:imidazolonepropionase-like amidohydrolase